VNYPDPFHQQFPPSPLPPVPPGPGDRYSPSTSSSRHTSPARQGGGDDSGWAWLILDAVLDFFGIWTNVPGETVRDRVKTTLLLLAGTAVLVGFLVGVDLLLSR
jgi:hypothetical protein